MRRTWRTVGLGLLVALASVARADAPTRVQRAYVGVYLKSIRNLHANEGTFEAQLLLWARWRSSNGQDPGALTIDNALHMDREELSREAQDGWTRVLWRISGTFHGRFSLLNFPFDSQDLTLTIAHPSLPASLLRLEPDVEHSGVDPELDIPGWLFEHRFAVFQGLAADGRDGVTVPGLGGSRVHFQIFLSRPLLSLLTKILLPLFIVLAMGQSTFWIEPSDASTRFMMVSTAVFAAICVHFTLSYTLPDAGHLVIADYYVFLVYSLLFGYIVSVTTSHLWFLRGWLVAVRRLDRFVRWGFPIVLVASAAYLSIPNKPHPAPPPARPASPVPELVIGTAQEPKRLGLGAEGAIEKFFTFLFLRPLASLDDRWELQPEIAASVPSFANRLWELHPDGGSAIHWKLRPGALWGDGTPIGPEDFVATHQVAPYPGVQKVVPTEDGAVFEYAQPRPDALFDVPLLPAHLLKGRSEQERQSLWQNDFPPLSGPFILESWTPGQEMRFRRNPHYAGGPASLERILIRLFPNKDELIAAVRAGTIGLVAQGDLTPDEADTLADEVPNMTAQVVDSTVLWHLEVNLEDPVLRDVRVRRALLLATDREAMIREVAHGRGEVAHSWLPPQHEGFDPSIRHVPYDPNAAAALLEEAGYTLGKDGLRLGAAGQPLHLSIAAISSRRAEVEFLKNAWKQVGIQVDFEEVPHDRFLGEYTAHRQFPQLAFYGFMTNPFDTGRKRWDQDRIPTEANGWTGENLSGWRNERVSEIYHRLEGSFNVEERVELLAEQQDLWAESLPILPLYTAKSAILHHVRLQNLRPHPSERAYLSWNAEAWTFEP
jgi:peptide/nickel transport system substrate-binding protein